MSAPRLLGCFALAVIATATTRAAETLPRYHFQPGQELTFRWVNEFKYGEGENAGAHGTKADWTVWVLRANADGSYRLVLREKSVFSQTHGKDKHEQPAQTQVVYADVFPDGRVTMNKSIQYRNHPEAIFPPLPANAVEAKAGWKSIRDDTTATYTPVENNVLVFDRVSESPFNKIYLSTSKARQTFDISKGFVTRIESEDTQGYGFNGKGTGKLELVDIKTADPEKMKEFAAAADKYFAATAAYDEKTEAGSKAKPDEAMTLLAKAVAELKTAEKDLTQPDFKADLAERVKRHEQMEKYYLDSAERRAQVLGKPAADFDTTDINGKKVKLSDLRGQVVVLDFWYRGCGWCIKAMPQMNQLADDFAGKPVAILGMNTDRKEDDAKFVIDKMGLKYGTLKAEGLPEKFGVQGFPTLIIIDPRGNVADIHVGYSPTLREDVGKVIRDLLAKQ
ncbi:MAG TPA: TlpA disulfide reductase family protein [Gemmataceae bacterium]|jgi:thiol-disulfide isomerase/thioredoxin|nr:TlpA disulfide reductase family protein [Gemmataceae bacterium]